MKTEKRYIFGSIFHQLCKRLLDIGGNGMIEFMEGFRTYYRNATDSALAEAFIHAIPQLSFRSDVYIIFDGIDECPDRPKLCKEILRIVHGQVKVLITSRDERDINEAFQNQMHVLFTEEQSRQDIGTHIEWSFEHDERLKEIKDDLKRDIKEILLSKSDGV